MFVSLRAAADGPQGWEILHCEELEKEWKEKIAEWDKHFKGEDGPADSTESYPSFSPI